MNNCIDDDLFSNNDSVNEFINQLDLFMENDYEEKEYNHLDVLKDKLKRNLVDEMLFDEEDLKVKKTKTYDEIFQNESIEDDNFLEQWIEYNNLESEKEPNISKEDDLDSNYNKLIYRGQDYYVKKRNFEFPICVMNNNLVQVGIIKEDDVNNIILF